MGDKLCNLAESLAVLARNLRTECACRMRKAQEETLLADAAEQQAIRLEILLDQEKTCYAALREQEAGEVKP